MYAGLLPWNSNNKWATGSRFLDKFSIVYVWRSTRQETLAQVVLMSVISHTFLPVWGPTLGRSLRLNCIPDHACGDENEDSVVERPSKKATGSSQRSSRHIEQLHRASLFSAPPPPPPHSNTPPQVPEVNVGVQAIFPVCQSRMDQSVAEPEVPRAGKDTELHCARLPFSQTYFGCATTHLHPLLKQ